MVANKRQRLRLKGAGSHTHAHNRGNLGVGESVTTECGREEGNVLCSREISHLPERVLEHGTLDGSGPQALQTGLQGRPQNADTSEMSVHGASPPACCHDKSSCGQRTVVSEGCQAGGGAVADHEEVNSTRANSAAGVKPDAWRHVGQKKNRKASLRINPQRQHKPSVDELHQLIRWVLCSVAPPLTPGSVRRRSGACKGLASERCPPWLRIQQPHLVTGVMVVILPYVDLSLVRSVQLEVSSFPRMVKEQLTLSRRVKVFRQRTQAPTLPDVTVVASSADPAQSTVDGSGDTEEGEINLPSVGSQAAGETPSKGQKGVLRETSGKKRSCQEGKPQPKRSNLGETEEEKLFLQGVLRTNLQLLPQGFSSFFQFLGSPGGPKIPMRYIHIDSGQHCPIVRGFFSSLFEAKNFRNVDLDNQPPEGCFDLDYYLLTADELKENQYPLPAESGGLPPGYHTIHPALALPPTWTSKSPLIPGSPSPLRSPRAPFSMFPAPVTAEQLFGLDCEMVLTASGEEVGRVSVVNFEGDTVFDVFVLPSSPVLDYRTKYSGLEETHLATADKSLADVHGLLRANLPAEAVLVGHSLESDLHALKLVHLRCIDTSVLYPHSTVGLKNPLKRLVDHFLPGFTMCRHTGHNSVDDARAALLLAKRKAEKGPAFGVHRRQFEPLGLNLGKLVGRADAADEACRTESGQQSRTPAEVERDGRKKAHPPLNIFFVDSLEHGRMEVLKGTRVFLEEDDDLVIQKCIDLLRERGTGGAVVAEPPLTHSHTKRQDLVASEQTTGAPESRPASEVQVGSALRSTGGGAQNALSKNEGCWPQQGLEEGSRALGSSHDTAGHHSASPGPTEGDRLCTTVGVCVLRGYQRLCSETAGLPWHQLYGFKHRAHELVLPKNRLKKQPDVCSTMNESGRRPTKQKRRYDWDGERHVGETGEQEGEAATTWIGEDFHPGGHSPLQQGKEQGTIEPPEERRDNKGATLLEVDRSTMQTKLLTNAKSEGGRGQVVDVEDLFPSVNLKKSLQCMAEMDNHLTTLLAEMQPNDILVLLSPCGNAARYLTLAAAKAALDCPPSDATLNRPECPTGDVLRSRRAGSGFTNCSGEIGEKAGKYRCSQKESTVTPPETDSSATPTTVASGTGFSAPVCECSESKIEWTPEIERELERARCVFQGPGGGAWAAFYLCPDRVLHPKKG
ncbi:exonuclease domain-containing [Cystoisospora suis]|uniref:Exonuclease domain-containing n=1 Tax=Cystoisospora suis TaxID=483139 RepID=A0A2C6L7F4_9APIC|nr:exonuclease domain-containing [Cystoisospora suis]